MLGDRIKACRKQRKISQTDLADMINVSQAAITSWERGVRKPDVDTVAKMADIFCVTTDYLIGRSDTPFYKHTQTDGSVVLSTQKEPPEQMPEEPTVRTDLTFTGDFPRDRKQLERLVQEQVQKALRDQRTNQ